MAGCRGDSQHRATRSEAAALAQALIPEGRPYQGMTVAVLNPPRDVPGWAVYLELDSDRELVGGKPLSTSLDDWRDSETGELRAMVEAAATTLVKRSARAGVQEQSASN